MRLAIAVLAALALTATPAAAWAAPDGTLTPASASVKAGDAITFTYSTPTPHPKNWIGLYTDPGNGPVDQKYVGPSLKWAYIPSGSGTARLDTDGLEPGDYVAYALAEDGYAWLAQPAKLRIVSSEPLRFVTSSIPLRNARAGSPYAATVRGLVRGEASGFRKVSGPGWLTVGQDGTITGTPPASASSKTATATVEARGAAGESATARVSVEVRPPGAPLVPELKTLSWNLWHGGSQVRGGREKQLKFLLERDIDVVGLQESSGTSAKELGEALGWDYYQAGADLGVISRYPITSRGPLPSESGLPASNVRIRIDDRRGSEVALWNVHLGYTPYGPYDACFGRYSVDRLMAREAQSAAPRRSRTSSGRWPATWSQPTAPPCSSWATSTPPPTSTGPPPPGRAATTRSPGRPPSSPSRRGCATPSASPTPTPSPSRASPGRRSTPPSRGLRARLPQGRARAAGPHRLHPLQGRARGGELGGGGRGRADPDPEPQGQRLDLRPRGGADGVHPLPVSGR
ncbi:putative Ig domain-containing protein [Nonomuraea recticatena]|uniref:putative Ig domain-containing protein n=1 Tax=Nonomuraea recticatena TaxID=46178 RepID=UPI0036241C8A